MKPLFLLLALFSCLAHAAPPNVILIVTDDQGYGDMSCHGNPWLKTPNIDRLHDEGVSLDDYHVDPYCTPTRAALMTGRYSIRVGAWAVTQGRQLLNPDETTMAEVFEASGYRTGMFGKWHLGDPYPYAPQYRGFQDVVCHKAGGVDEIGNPRGNNYFDDIYYRNGVPEAFEGYCTDIFFSETLRFIREGIGSEDPFFVYLPLNAMHGPVTVEPKYSNPFLAQGIPMNRSKFFGMVQNFDENLGRLLDSLEEWGLDENTLVIFMGDNGTGGGMNNGQRDPTEYNAGMRGKKGSTYEGGHRVACFARWPIGFEAGKTIDALTSHHDWLPTFIDICGLEAPQGVAFDGESILPLLKGEANRWKERTVFIDRQADQLELWDPRVEPGQRYPSRAVLTERWRMVNGELFDIQQDPSQETDVASRFPEVVDTLSAKHAKFFEDVTSHKGKYTPFIIGAPEQNPTQFTTRDWHPTEGGVIWKMSLVRDESVYVNGFWALDVQRSGTYALRISRYPGDEVNAIGANRARIRIGDTEQTLALNPNDTEARFDVDLEAGETLLQTWFKDAETERERGAYYVEATYLGQ